MCSTRRTFTPEFKHEAVQLVLETGRPIAQIALELGIGEQMLGRWIKQEKHQLKKHAVDVNHANTADLLEENIRLRKKIQDLEKDQDILEKAAAFFARKK